MQIPTDLYEYQKEDYKRILDTDGSFLVLSEMGTGKTPTALAVSELGSWEGKTLIVCPRTLQLEWARQILDWCGFEASVARKSCYRRLETLFSDFIGGKDSPYFIINYESFATKRHLDVLKHYPFGLVVLDEAHKLKNPDTKRTKGMFEFLSARPDVKVLPMTGSPIVNNPMDLLTLLRIVRPKDYNIRGIKWAFLDNYCRYERGRYGVKVYGSKNLDLLRKQTASFTIRRTKKEVLPYLPEKYYRKVVVEMPEEQRGLYDQMKNEMMILLDNGEPLYAPGVLAALTRLRQLSIDPRLLGADKPSAKTEFILDFLEEDGGKTVVFSCFESYVRILSKSLSEMGIKHVTITGGKALEERAAAVKQFQEDEDTQVVLGTVQTMGEGLTLTAASNCIFSDRWWSPAVNSQAEDRLHRIGQKNAVQIVIPMCERSIDQSLDRILTSKKGMAEEYLGDRQIMKEVVDDLRQT